MIDSRDINSLQSESGVIATLIYHPEFCFYSEGLLPNYFVNEDNGKLYAAIVDLTKRGIYTIDAYNISTCETGSSIPLERINEFIEMSHVLARGTLEEYKALVQNILNAAFRRNTYIALQKCMALCQRDDTNLEQDVYSEIDKVMMDFSVAEDDVPEFKDVVDGLWKDVEDHQDGSNAGIPFKFPTLNDYVRIEPGELVVVGAPAKGAKSMFMLNEAVDILKQGKSVFYLDSELSSRLFLCRLVSHLTQIEFSRVRSGRYNDEEKARIAEAIKWVKQQRLVHLYMPIFSERAIYTAVKKVSHKFGKLDVLIVDYLKPTGSSTEAYAVYSELGNLTDMVKNDIAGKMGIAGLAAAQLNTNNKLADSAKIARNASTIMFLTDKTPEEITDDGGREAGNKKLVVVQNRNGMQHVDGEWINIDFDGNRCTLTEAGKQHVAKEPF